MNITFQLVDDKYINVMNGDNKIGHIFVGSGAQENVTNVIQVCGFEEAFDLWGCGVFGEDKEYIKNIPQDQKTRLLETWKQTGDEFYKNLAEVGFTKETRTVMKKDIQLLFSDYKKKEYPMNGVMTDCSKCYNKPCTCEVREDHKDPYVTKRSTDEIIKSKLEWVNKAIKELNDEERGN